MGNLAYASQSEAQRLDLYLPPDAEPPLPLLVFIHGGAWMAGDKRNEYAAGVVPLFVGRGIRRREHQLPTVGRGGVPRTAA